MKIEDNPAQPAAPSEAADLSSSLNQSNVKSQKEQASMGMSSGMRNLFNPPNPSATTSNFGVNIEATLDTPSAVVLGPQLQSKKKKKKAKKPAKNDQLMDLDLEGEDLQLEDD